MSTSNVCKSYVSNRDIKCQLKSICCNGSRSYFHEFTKSTNLSFLRVKDNSVALLIYSMVLKIKMFM